MTETPKARGRRAGGRPRSANPRTERISVPVTPDEKARVATLARGAGLATYVRAAALGRQFKAPRQIPELNREAWRDLAPLAANLNQLAHSKNLGGQIDADRLAELLHQVRQLLHQVRGDLIGRG